MKQLTILILVLFTALNSYAQEVNHPISYKERKLDFAMGLNNQFLKNDYLLGTTLGVMNANRNFHAYFAFDFRPFRKKILAQQSANYFFQHFEQRFYTGVGAEYFIYRRNKNYGMFIQSTMMHTWAIYGGTEITPPNGLIVVPRLGFMWQVYTHGFLKAGFGFLDDKVDREQNIEFVIQFTGLIKREYE